jgi:hypothetical protein
MRIFGVDYQFLSCGDVFTKGLESAAVDVGIEYAHAAWDAPFLEQAIRSYAPDLVFVVHGRRFSQRFPNARCFGARTAVWLLDEPYEVDDTASFSKQFDHVFVCDQSTLRRHERSSYLPVCYDPHRHVAKDGEKRGRVGFIGGANSKREKTLAALARAQLLDYVVGGFWSDDAINARCITANCSPDVTADLYAQTRIIVNVFREQHHFNAQGIGATAMNPRIYEALACGALVVSEWREEIARRIPHLPVFRSDAECVDITRALLSEPKAFEFVRKTSADQLVNETYAARLATVVEVASGVAA